MRVVFSYTLVYKKLVVVLRSSKTNRFCSGSVAPALTTTWCGVKATLLYLNGGDNVLYQNQDTDTVSLKLRVSFYFFKHKSNCKENVFHLDCTFLTPEDNNPALLQYAGFIPDK